jgi:hypothetical protein
MGFWDFKHLYNTKDIFLTCPQCRQKSKLLLTYRFWRVPVLSSWSFICTACKYSENSGAVFWLGVSQYFLWVLSGMSIFFLGIHFVKGMSGVPLDFYMIFVLVGAIVLAITIANLFIGTYLQFYLDSCYKHLRK